MRILQVIGSLDRGGAETFLMNVLRNIDRDKFSFVFLCYGDSTSDYDNEAIRLGAKIVRIPEFKDVGILQHIKDVRRVIRDNEIDVVHVHTYYNSVFSLIAAKLSGIRLRITHSHNTMSEANPGLSKRIYFVISKLGIALFSNKFLACGQEAGRALFLPGSQFAIIYNGINIKDFSYDETIRKGIRKELNINDDETVVMHVGRFVEAKNHKFLIAIFDEYCQFNANSKLLLIGDGPLRPSIEHEVKRRALSDRVIFLGKRSDMTSLYNGADLLVFPSLFEGLPVVLVEVQANGLHSLVSDKVDESAKLNKRLEFMSLSSSPKAWAYKMSSINIARKTGEKSSLLDGPYDITNVTQELVKLYNGNLEV